MSHVAHTKYTWRIIIGLPTSDSAVASATVD